ncbi:MAG: PAS domain-containing protein [Candidatus Manganitrophus sp.]|nr:PAS domain-containing protein [Candidatus Manganitrophus sp.]
MEILRGLSLRSGICAPLLGREHPMGVLSLWMADSNRRYRESDLTFAVELARRAALAVDNARLYQKAQEELEERKRAEEKVRFQAYLLDVIGQAVIATDLARGDIIYWNHFAEKLYGWSSEEVVRPEHSGDHAGFLLGRASGRNHGGVAEGARSLEG